MEHSQQLLALTLSFNATKLVRQMHTALFRITGNPLPLALPPLIILGTPREPVNIKQLDIPLMPSFVLFDTLLTYNGAYYLSSSDPNYLEVYHRCADSLGPSSLIGRHEGFYIGTTEGEKPSYMSIKNDDWRLVHYNCVWHSKENKVAHVHYQVLGDFRLQKRE
jgi:hypothetical protein